ncbi:MAG TPA: SagB family peptide dehydrogenase [Pirellulales bacterium]|nr:SagB family peptide dehydrogenase [Pirellulales bacterium]
MSVSLQLSWQDRVSLTANGSQAVVLGPGTRIALSPVVPEIVDALQRLAPPGEPEDRLADSILASGGAGSLARWFYHLGQLHQRGLIRRSLYADGKPLVTVVPLCRAAGPSTVNVETGVGNGNGRSPGTALHGTNGSGLGAATERAVCVLSRFAYLRSAEGRLVLESPLAHSRVVLHDPRAVAVVAALAAPSTVADLAEKTDLTAPMAGALVALLIETQMAERAGAEGSAAQSDRVPLDSWEFHDLLFHSRSRRGRSDGAFGGTYRLAHCPPPPAVKEHDNRPWHDLHHPDLERLQRDDPPLAAVQERRQSLRQYAAQPIGAEQLGEFLYRVARVTHEWESEASTPSGRVTVPFAARPYPAGGGLYELEFYVAVRACRDLAPGLYYYDPRHHRLASLCGKTREVGLLLDEAAASAGMAPQTLQVLVVLSARFQRLAWKYESIAYSLVLKHVGVVFQTMYLAATAMGLAPCAVGCGDSDLFARAAGTDYYAETSVGEFLLGSRE